MEELKEDIFRRDKHRSAIEDKEMTRTTRMVINVQPNVNSGYRASLPVSTTNWQTNPRRQFIPVSGLDFLIGVRTLLITQTVELNELTTKMESENRYIVKIPNAESLYIGSEVSSSRQRCLCGAGRAFRMHLHDNTRQEVMQLHRRLAGANCCFPCRLQEMTVIMPPGDYMGRVQQQWTWMVPFYLVRDASDSVLFVLEGPRNIKKDLANCEFKILSGDALRETGKIVHEWDRELVSFTTTLHMPDTAVQPKHKALLLAAAFLLEYVMQGPSRFDLDYEAMASCKKILCTSQKTIRDKSWDHYEYHVGEKDENGRKNGFGHNYWSGPESLESYDGNFLRDTMHQYGEYRWRHLGFEGTFQTYEGYFYANRMHGYGTISYQDGRVFSGLFYSDCRWGPGIQTHVDRRVDVGIWRGPHLIRLTWKPEGASPIPDLLNQQAGINFVAQFRKRLAHFTQEIKKNDETNLKNESLLSFGPSTIALHQNLLYPKFLDNSVYYNKDFDMAYYDGYVVGLKEISSFNSLAINTNLDRPSKSPSPPLNEKRRTSKKDLPSPDQAKPEYYQAWNNTQHMIDLMKHCYQHHSQVNQAGFELKQILSGPRNCFRALADHEANCRAFLLSCFVGDIGSVTRLVNECNVYADLVDVRGNSGIMYAVCGNQLEAIHFLVQAQANVDSFNDACCTPLGMALLRYAATTHSLNNEDLVKRVLPQPDWRAPRTPEWNIFRLQLTTSQSVKSASSGQNLKSSSLKKLRSMSSTKNVRKDSLVSKQGIKNDLIITSETSADVLRFMTILYDYESAMKAFAGSEPSNSTTSTYLFQTSNLINDVETAYTVAAKPTSPKKEKKGKNAEKAEKGDAKKDKKEKKKPEPVKNKQIVTNEQSPNTFEYSSASSVHIIRLQNLARRKSTVLHLLSEGADPNLVQCPMPAMILAIICEDDDLVKALIKHGVDSNQIYSQMLNYTALDFAVSKPFTDANLQIIQALLKNGANANRRLQDPDYDVNDQQNSPRKRPTLLHAVLVRQTTGQVEEEIRDLVLDLLLSHGCDAYGVYNSVTPLDYTMNKCLKTLDVFIKNPRVNLNGVINESQQSILLKIFSMPYFNDVSENDNELRTHLLTNLLLYGADPFLECSDDDEKYANLFLYIRRKLESHDKGLEVPSHKPRIESAVSTTKKDGKGNKTDRSAKPGIKRTSSSKCYWHFYKDALELVNGCARMLRIRWIQAKLVEEIVDLARRYKHRAWHLIMKEHKNKKQTQLWLKPERCVEIWCILQDTGAKVYNDLEVLNHVLCIVYYYHLQDQLSKKLQFSEKEIIEKKVKVLIRDAIRMAAMAPLPYVKPELIPAKDKRYNACFDCSLPNTETSLPCYNCKLVSFCNSYCMLRNIKRTNVHPCNDYLIHHYYPELLGGWEQEEEEE